MIDVRAATALELPVVAEIARAAWRNAYQGLIASEPIDETLRQWYSPQAMARRLEWGGLDVAVIEAEVAGFMQHRTVDATTHEVYAIYVRPELIGKGAGWALWQRAHQSAVRNGAEAIELWVLAGNRLGIQWYERQGGRQVGRQTVQMLDGDHEELRYRFDLLKA